MVLQWLYKHWGSWNEKGGNMIFTDGIPTRAEGIHTAIKGKRVTYKLSLRGERLSEFLQMHCEHGHE